MSLKMSVAGFAKAIDAGVETVNKKSAFDYQAQQDRAEMFHNFCLKKAPTPFSADDIGYLWNLKFKHPYTSEDLERLETLWSIAKGDLKVV